ncbi:uncharacterized protein LOC122850488 [Aphidius gifuensis]|uniref:uncharacterized protein LOC122850488 n=1 Tax=Aphidius gifuensis TaxID=684658 RepID=UPI001CDC5C44|nr:uncharacterized protein LOC122850488 [Aphidius gifuensis]
MSFLHNNSCECTKSELDLFTIPPTQTTIEDSTWAYYNPISSMSDDSQIEFHVPGTSEEYIDLPHTLLKIRAKIVDKNGAAAPATDAVGPIDLTLHSLFEKVDVLFNQKLVSASNGTYPCRAYIETILNYGYDATNSHLQLALWYPDTPGRMNTNSVAAADAKNEGLVARCVHTNAGKQFKMIGHLHVDVFNQEKFLLNGIEMKINLTRSKQEFCLMDASNDKDYKIQILEASLIVRRVKLNPHIMIAHAKALAKTTAEYPLTRVEVKSFLLTAGILGNCLANIIIGTLPKRVVIGFVDNRGFNGNRLHNPFYFQHFNINFLCLYVDGKQIPGKPLQPTFFNNIFDAEAYHTLFSATGIHFGDHGMQIDRDSYRKGYTLFASDLTPDLSAHSAGHWNLFKSGSLRIEVRSSEALAQVVNCLVYAEYDNIIEIDSSRQVIMDYSN